MTRTSDASFAELLNSVLINLPGSQHVGVIKRLSECSKQMGNRTSCQVWEAAPIQMATTLKQLEDVQRVPHLGPDRYSTRSYGDLMTCLTDDPSHSRFEQTNERFVRAPVRETTAMLSVVEEAN